MGDKPVLFVSNSGGRSSEHMAAFMIDILSDGHNLIHVFANTGLEHEETLNFINRCDKEFGLNLVWIEAVIHHNQWKGSTHKIVTFETASRKGEPFEEMIKEYGIPNAAYPGCNRELKLNPIFSFKKSLGFKASHKMAVGIRVDEMDRQALDRKKTGAFYPLISMKPTNKAEIRHWWKDKGFDLEISDHEGNCVTCWKKSDRKLLTIAKHNPEYFEFFDRMEKEYGFAGAPVFEKIMGDVKHTNKETGEITYKKGVVGYGDIQIPRVFFRKNRSAADIIATSKNTSFVEYVDNMPELQLDMLGHDINPLDIEDDCGASCEL